MVAGEVVAAPSAGDGGMLVPSMAEALERWTGSYRSCADSRQESFEVQSRVVAGPAPAIDTPEVAVRLFGCFGYGSREVWSE